MIYIKMCNRIKAWVQKTGLPNELIYIICIIIFMATVALLIDLYKNVDKSILTIVYEYALILTLRDNNKLVRREASTALSRMGQIAVDPLIEILDDEDWRVRGAAAWALGNLKDDAAIEPLEALLEDESGYVRAGALNAINSIKS